jgi:hypothetical protein
LARYWPGKGDRHDVGLTLGGFFARAGFDVPKIKQLVEAIARAARDEEVRDRIRAAADAANEFRTGRRARGLPAIKETFGEVVGRKIAEWLEYKGQSEEGISHINGAPLSGLKSTLPLVLTSSQFVAGFSPPEYLIDGIMQCGYLYSLTARTGHGKTAVSMYIGQCIARGLKMHGQEVKKGTVLILAGENPDDIRARYLILADANKFDVETMPVRFIAGVIDIAASMPAIHAAAETIDDLVLVIVDTAAAYFRGDDANSNTQQGEYARLLRQLTFLPGKPAVLVPCHPVKKAARDNLLPVGGGSFLNEVDGNLTLWANADRQTTLHWLGKFRGPEFEPLTFEMETVESERVVDAKGRRMPSVVAKPVSESKIQLTEGTQQREEDLLLGFIAADRNASIADLAIKCNFISTAGNPQKSKTYAMCQRLVEEKLLEKRGSKYRITNKGKKEIGWSDKDD